VSEREWIGRRLPLWALLLIGPAFLTGAGFLFALVDSTAILIAASPLSFAGFYTLAYTAGELRRRTDPPQPREDRRSPHTPTGYGAAMSDDKKTTTTTHTTDDGGTTEKTTTTETHEESTTTSSTDE
jgi:hypothetical protein